MSAKSTTTFTSRGRLTGLIRDEAPAGTGQNRASRAARRRGGPGVRRRGALLPGPPDPRRVPPPPRPLRMSAGRCAGAERSRRPRS